MKNVVYVSLLGACLFASSAKAKSTFICEGQRQKVLLEVGDPRVEIESYNECNGGVGDEMTNCQPHSYQLVVEDAFLKIEVEEGYLYDQATLIGSDSGYDGFTIATYQDSALHLDVNVNNLSAIIRMKIMNRGTPGNPIELANYTIPCQPLPKLELK